MKCYRLDLRRKYSRFVHEMLPPSVAKKVEKHLTGCPECRSLVERLKTVDQWISGLPVATPVRDPWPRIEADLRQRNPRRAVMATWRNVAVFVVFGLISGVLGAVMYGIFAGRALSIDYSFRTEDFIQVPIGHISTNTEPHIVTEGYVSEVRIDGEDGDRVFKLVEDIRHPGPFVICELIDPLDLPAPPVGSRVRVYGVSRYDGKSDHEWNEVHPVLNIEILKR